MMIYPPIAELVNKTGSRYTLVIETARRARQLSQGATPLSKADSNKEVSIAINEIYEGKVSAVSSNMFHPTIIETNDADNFEE